MDVILIPTLVLFAAYMFSSSGSLISEKSGVANISIEGNMVMGAILYCVFMNLLNNGSQAEGAWAIMTPLFAVMFSGILTGIFSMLFAVVVVRFNGDQIITGTGINLLAPAIATFLGYMTFGNAGSASIYEPTELASGGMEYLYPVLFTILGILLVCSIGFYFNKTKGGLRIKAAGENPYALETSGISVSRVRMNVLFISGILSGIGGAIWVQQLHGSFGWTVLGAGFMSIGIVIFSQWKVKGIIPGSLVIALLSAVAMNYLSIGSLEEASAFVIFILNSLPYLIPLVVLMVIKSTSAPKKLGVPFQKDQR